MNCYQIGSWVPALHDDINPLHRNHEGLLDIIFSDFTIKAQPSGIIQQCLEVAVVERMNKCLLLGIQFVFFSLNHIYIYHTQLTLVS